MRTMLVLVAASVVAAEVMVAEVIAKLKRGLVCLLVHRTHWTSHPKMIDRSIVVEGLAVFVGGSRNLWGPKVCLDGNARYAIAQRSAQANVCLAKWERPFVRSPCSQECPRNGAPEHCKKPQCGQVFLWGLSVWTTVNAQRDKHFELECENGGQTWLERGSHRGWNWRRRAQDRSPLDREGQTRTF